uniref:Uncharacterized protein n=1 Tax=Pararge aegeria TaxID=116150 RepID=S4P262_9NEOP
MSMNSELAGFRGYIAALEFVQLLCLSTFASKIYCASNLSDIIRTKWLACRSSLRRCHCQPNYRPTAGHRLHLSLYVHLTSTVCSNPD